MKINAWRLTFKSWRRRLIMGVLDKISTEHRVSVHQNQIMDYVDPDKKTTDLLIEFHIYRHTYRFGKGDRGMSFQFNVTCVSCLRHFLDLNLKYHIATDTYYGLDPDEYFKLLQQKMQRLNREDGDQGRWYVNKRILDYP